MAAGPQYSDEVQVVLKSVKESPKSDPFDRSILLTKKNPKLIVGRSSKRDARLSPGAKNGWFDSAVMSRSHAKVTYLPDSNALTLMDTESLHGTFVNNKRISNLQGHILHQNDVVRFGVPIQKGSEVFPACEVEVTFKRGSISPEKRPAVFKVPDSTDGEDETSDIDATIETSVALIQEAGMASSPMSHHDSVKAIDLTVEDDVNNDASAAQNGSPGPDEGIPDEKGFQAAKSHQDSLRWMSEDVDNFYEDSEVITTPPKSTSSPMIDSDDDDLFHIIQDDDDVVAKASFDKSQVDDLENAAAPTISHSGGPLTQEPGFELDVAPSDIYLPSTCNLTDSAHSSIEHSDINDNVSVEDLGAKSGKSEFFAAREHNRRKCYSYNEDDKETNNGVSVKSAAGDDGKSVSEPSSVLSSRLPRNCTTDSASSASVAAGKRLDSLIDFVPPEQDESRGDFYHDASAYTGAAEVMVSGKAKATLQPNPQLQEPGCVLASTHAHLDFPAAIILPRPSDIAYAEGHRSGKRKADDISQLVCNEEIADLSTIHPAPAAGSTEGSFNDPSMTTVNNEQPQFKRIRRVAEAVGYAALGGVAVMSALIATAPAL